MASRAIEVLTVRIGSETDEVLQGLEKVAVKAQRVSRRMQRTGRSLTVGLTLPLLAAGAAATQMASSAEESANKFNVVMGSAADGVRSRLESLTETIPLTTAEMERMAGGIQDLLVPMGVARVQAAGMSADFVEMAGDVASFNDVLPTEVLEAMSSALAGSSEPMRRFGVDTRVARLQALALEAGLIKQGEALDNAATAQAVMLAIQRDSTDAMGDAARTVESTSNRIKFLQRDAKQLGITIGEILIPVVSPLIAKARDLIGVVQGLDREVLAVSLGLAAAAAAIGPLLIAGGKLVSVFGLIITPAGLVLAALAALATTAVVVWKNWDVLALKGVLAWTALKDGIFSVVSGILGALERLPLVGDKIAELRAEFDAMAEESLANANAKILELEGRLNTTGAAMAAAGAAGAEVAGGLDRATASTGILIPEVGELNASLSNTLEVAPPVVVALHEAGASADEAGDSFSDLASMTDVLGYAIGDMALGGLDAMVDFATGAGDAIGAFVKRAMADLAKLALRMAFVKGITSLLPGVGSFLGFGNFAGGFADGGHVPAGQWGIAGEAGPEIVSGPTVVQGPANVTPMSGGLSLSFTFPEPRSPTDMVRDPLIAQHFAEQLRYAVENGAVFE